VHSPARSTPLTAGKHNASSSRVSSPNYLIPKCPTSTAPVTRPHASEGACRGTPLVHHSRETEPPAPLQLSSLPIATHPFLRLPLGVPPSSSPHLLSTLAPGAPAGGPRGQQQHRPASPRHPPRTPRPPSANGDVPAQWRTSAVVHGPSGAPMTVYQGSPVGCRRTWATAAAAGRRARSCIRPPSSHPFAVRGLNHIALAVPDLEGAAEHYRTVLGRRSPTPT